jgi:hypothetical protein
MINSNLRRSLFAAVAALTLVAPAFAGTQDTLVLRGSVAPILQVSLTPQGIASSMDLTKSVDNMGVATVLEIANDVNGYTVTFSSQNNGSLVGTQPNNTGTVPYSLNYNQLGVFSLGGGPKTFTNSTLTPAAGLSKPISISYPLVWVAADTYVDTVTVTIAAL